MVTTRPTTLFHIFYDMDRIQQNLGTNDFGSVSRDPLQCYMGMQLGLIH
jgi:hypothetical protein